MKNKILGIGYAALALLAALAPAAHAQVVATGAPGLGNWFNLIKGTLQWAFPALITLIIAYMLWMVFQYVKAKDSDGKLAAELGKKILFTIIALVAVLAIWGIMAFISSTLGLGIGGQINSDFIPGVQGFQDTPHF